MRPDGTEPASASALDRPPREPGFAAVLEFGAEEPTLTGSGRLVTLDFVADFDGFARVGQLGEGAEAIVAPAGHELALARLAPGPRSGTVRGVLLVDGQERELPRWRTSEEPQTLVVVVPEGTGSVELLVENQGRPQTISLDDGALAPGFPLALYRDFNEINEPVTARIELPVGEGVVVSGSLESSSWNALDDEREWLPAGRARLVIAFGNLTTDRPCCEAIVEDVIFTSTLVDDDTGERFVDGRSPDRRSIGDPWFDVPETLESATYELEIEITFTVDDVVDEVSTVVAIPLRFP